MGHEVSFGRHRFDPRTGRLWAGRREVNLTPRAAAVLAALIERAGELVTRQELFRSVWGDTIVGDAALTACIQELRGALADDTRRPRFIETRHRRGYRFVARVLPSAPQGASSVSPSPAHPRPAALVVGRDRELSELRGCLERATNGDRQIVFVTGEPGIGKTTAVELFLAEAASGDRLRIAQGRCIETHGRGRGLLAAPGSHDPPVPRARRRADRTPAPPARSDVAHPDALGSECLGAEDTQATNIRRHAGADAARIGRGRRGHGVRRPPGPLAGGPPLERSLDRGLAGLSGEAPWAGARSGARLVPARGADPRASARGGQGRAEGTRTLPRRRAHAAGRDGGWRVPGPPLPRGTRVRRTGRDDL